MKKHTYFIVIAALIICNGMSAGQDMPRPNDPYFDHQIGFYHRGVALVLHDSSCKPSMKSYKPTAGIHLDMPSAWSITTGSSDVVVAILDDGFFYQHEDLRDNIWQNPGETGIDAMGFDKRCNGIDDDANGYVDDVMGWDFIFDDPDPDAYIFDGRRTDRIALYLHSTPAMGIIGAKGNNGVGVAGMNWQISMMLLKLCAQGDTGGQRPENAARAIRYAVDNGARAINWSGFIEPDSSPEKIELLSKAFDYAERHDVLIILGAGNYRQDHDEKEFAVYPQAFDHSNIITVAELDFDGDLYVADPESRFIGGSDFGRNSVHIAALAQYFTTDQHHNVSVYSRTGGTSNAAPAVTGLAAMIWSVAPRLGGAEVKQIILDSATPLPALQDKLISGGMINPVGALKMAIGTIG